MEKPLRDPYAVLAEIAAVSPPQTSKSSPAAAPSSAATDAPGSFTTTPQEQEKPPEGLLPLVQGKDAQGKDTKDTQDKESQGKEAQGKEAQGKDPKVDKAADAPRPQEPADNAAPSQAPNSQSNLQSEDSRTARSREESRSATATAAKLKSDIAKAINNSAHMPDLPHIEVQVTPEGILISLTDDANYSMFAIGSAEPQPETVQIMEKIGQILKVGSSSIVIRESL